jgi:hypothetical protein
MSVAGREYYTPHVMRVAGREHALTFKKVSVREHHNHCYASSWKNIINTFCDERGWKRTCTPHVMRVAGREHYTYC